jgi:RNA polymerase-binding protein DksA
MNIEEQKQQLLETQKELDEQLTSLGRKISDDGDWIAVPDESDGTLADPVDNADITEDFEEKIAVLKVLEERYAQVQKALDAIEAGTYGICENTGKPISEERLKANPSATTCIDCG